jgi:hypothetical protein
MVAGDIREINFSHPTIGSGTLFPKSAEDSTVDYGWLRSSDEAQMIDGGGNMIDQMNRVRWSVETVISTDLLIRLDVEKVIALASDPVQADWTISHVSGAVYGGKGKPVGDIQVNWNQGTMTLKLSGGGIQKKISG